MEVWVKSAEINYKSPADSDLSLVFKLKEEDIQKALNGLQKEGKFEVWHTVEAINRDNIICAEAKVLVYIKNYKNLNLNNC